MIFGSIFVYETQVSLFMCSLVILFLNLSLIDGRELLWWDALVGSQDFKSCRRRKA